MGLLRRREPVELMVKVEQLRDEFRAAGKDSILNEALRQGVPLPHGCTVGTCGTCKAKLVEGKVRELTDSAVALSAEELRAGYILPCQSVARSPLRLDIPQLADLPDHPFVMRKAEIVLQRGLTHDIVELGLRLDGPMEYTAGQYAEIGLPDQAHLRAYSFSCGASRRAQDYVSFFIRQMPGGEFTGWLFGDDRTGTVLECHGPFGNLWLRPGDGPVLCIAGGSGLGPIKSIVEAARDQEVDREFTVVFGVRTQRDLYCVGAIEEIGRFWGSRFRFVPILSEEPAGSGWNGATGFVTEAIGRLPESVVKGSDAYVCGPPPMVDAVEAQLLSIGVDAGSFHADRFLDTSGKSQQQKAPV